MLTVIVRETVKASRNPNYPSSFLFQIEFIGHALATVGCIGKPDGKIRSRKVKDGIGKRAVVILVPEFQQAFANQLPCAIVSDELRSVRIGVADKEVPILVQLIDDFIQWILRVGIRGAKYRIRWKVV